MKASHAIPNSFDFDWSGCKFARVATRVRYEITTTRLTAFDKDEFVQAECGPTHSTQTAYAFKSRVHTRNTENKYMQWRSNQSRHDLYASASLAISSVYWLMRPCVDAVAYTSVNRRSNSWISNENWHFSRKSVKMKLHFENRRRWNAHRIKWVRVRVCVCLRALVLAGRTSYGQCPSTIVARMA